MPETLHDKTLRLLREDPRNLSQIATGSGIGYFFLRHLKGGKIADPGVKKIEQLHAFLTRK